MKNLVITKRGFVLSTLAAFFICSCGANFRTLGDDDFVIYQGDGTVKFTQIGRYYPNGLLHDLVQGDIKRYGFNEIYVVTELAGGQYYYFSKSAVRGYYSPKSSARTTLQPNPVIGPIGIGNFEKATQELGLPFLSFSL
jgi:hypothetical protein